MISVAKGLEKLSNIKVTVIPIRAGAFGTISKKQENEKGNMKVVKEMNHSKRSFGELRRLAHIGYK